MASSHVEPAAVTQAIAYLIGIQPHVSRFSKLTVELNPGQEFPIIGLLTNPGEFPQKPMARMPR